MIKKRFLFVALIAGILYISINYSPDIREKVLSLPLAIKSYILHKKENITKKFTTLINQKKQITALQKELKICQKTATLSVAFASKLNHFLEEKGLAPYEPGLYPVQALSYVTLGDFSTMWLDFPDYNQTLIYGLLYKGFAAGIVDEKEGKPIGRLLNNPKMIFSVEIGKKKHLGVVFGDKDFLRIKYIPSYADIQVGDEVVTSGNDNIFYEGVKVGEVVHVRTTTLYKMALVKPYIELNNPEFFYAVDVHTSGINERNSTLFSDALK
ncbi:MAG: rod shape-determining protein MreC [Sulfurospirillum sp.]|nr:MAG: rod shape-determining protein MreC [Sulfurospirillum sp.]